MIGIDNVSGEGMVVTIGDAHVRRKRMGIEGVQG